MSHANNCLVHEDGPCDCGFEEILEDEAREAEQEHLEQE
jgi:hypothetical protein